MSSSRQRRRLPTTLAVLAAACCLAPIGSRADYPERPLRMLVEFPAGGASDVVARRVALRLSERFGQPVVVENRSGAGGVIAHETVAQSPPDGYSLLLATTSVTTNPWLHKKLPYDTLRDFAPVALLTDWAGLLVVHPSVPVKSLSELIKLAKASPGKLTYASAGVGSWIHLATEMLKMRAGVNIVHVPYKGAVPALQDVLAGFVMIKIDSYITAMPHVKAGRLKLLAVSTAERIPQLPDVPAFSEQGLPGFDSTIWLGVMARAGTPKNTLAKLEQNIVAIIKERSMSDKLVEDGYRPRGNGAVEFGAFVRKELAQWQQVVKDAHITAAD
ncbi:MAG TPA: tripartite tricarboxylate transporter substrate binding protein [Burkholderiales bacterium]|nr:tripartite tricarboxylate transporter substrate binding protein [Burkholderiales bacterium]